MMTMDAGPGLDLVGGHGGAGSGEPDLWCTYAALRTLRWLGRTDAAADRDGTARYLRSRRNADGGYAWSQGMPSDAWATFYCTQGLRDLDEAPDAAEQTAAWVSSTWTGEAYAMMPGQRADVWATHFQTRTTVDLCSADIPDAEGLLRWLGELQTASGGLVWSPAHAPAGAADVRACYYGIASWTALRSRTGAAPPWNVEALVEWLLSCQDAEGGFRFGEQADVPCLWASYRATAALAALGATPDPNVARWMHGLRGRAGSFVRWAGYDVEDVWANFCAVGVMRAVDKDVASDVALHKEAVVDATRRMAVPGGGYTYRAPESASDALSTAARVLGEPDRDTSQDVAWLEGCQLPNEGGVMYMPGRGAEIRCTLWALTAGALLDRPVRLDRVADWLTFLQNPDGGFGYWEGRASDLVSTASVAALLDLLGRAPETVVDTEGMRAFVGSCASSDGGGHSPVPGASSTLRAGLQALRILHTLGGGGDPDEVDVLLRRHRVRGGGFADRGARMPDLLTTYEAVLASDTVGLDVDSGHVAAFLDRVSTDRGVAWTPLAPPDEGPLAACLASLLRRRLDRPAGRLPALALS